MKVGDRFDVWEVLKQPHDWYLEIGKSIISLRVDDDIISHIPGASWTDIYYWNPSSELKKIGTLIITKVK